MATWKDVEELGGAAAILEAWLSRAPKRVAGASLEERGA
jgi:hypothetical protein